MTLKQGRNLDHGKLDSPHAQDSREIEIMVALLNTYQLYFRMAIILFK